MYTKETKQMIQNKGAKENAFFYICFALTSVQCFLYFVENVKRGNFLLLVPHTDQCCSSGPVQGFWEIGSCSPQVLPGSHTDIKEGQVMVWDEL